MLSKCRQFRQHLSRDGYIKALVVCILRKDLITIKSSKLRLTGWCIADDNMLCFMMMIREEKIWSKLQGSEYKKSIKVLEL